MIHRIIQFFRPRYAWLSGRMLYAWGDLQGPVQCVSMSPLFDLDREPGSEQVWSKDLTEEYSDINLRVCYIRDGAGRTMRIRKIGWRK